MVIIMDVDSHDKFYAVFLHIKLLISSKHRSQGYKHPKWM